MIIFELKSGCFHVLFRYTDPLWCPDWHNLYSEGLSRWQSAPRHQVLRLTCFNLACPWPSRCDHTTGKWASTLGEYMGQGLPSPSLTFIKTVSYCTPFKYSFSFTTCYKEDHFGFFPGCPCYTLPCPNYPANLLTYNSVRANILTRIPERYLHSAGHYTAFHRTAQETVF